MRKLKSFGYNLTLLLGFVYTLCSPSIAFSDPTQSSFWEFDKKEHFAVSAAISSFTYLGLRKQEFGRWESLVTCVALSVLVGTAKEVHDREVDPNDIKADSIGSLLGGGVFFTIDLFNF